MKQLKINGHNIAMIPSDWKDLSPEQVKAICCLSLASPNGLYMKVQLFLIIAKMQLSSDQPLQIGTPDEHRFLYKMRSKKTGTILVDTTDINFVVSEFDFLFSSSNGQTYIESQIVVNHFQRFTTRLVKRVYGPDSALYNITFDEFIRAETLYSQIAESQDAKLINKFCATLYRPKDKNVNTKSPGYSGDIREPFNDHLVMKNSRITEYLQPWKKVYIRMFYEGCRAFIIKKHPQAFASGGEPSCKPKPVFEGLNSLVTALCDNDATRAGKLRKTLLWDVLSQLEAAAVHASSLKNKQL